MGSYMKPLGEILIAALVVGGSLLLLNLFPIDATVKKVVSAIIIIVALVITIKFLFGI